MSDDPFLDFIMSRDPAKVLSEARPAPLEVLYAEASMPERERLFDPLPIGVLRRKLLDAQREASRPVRVIGNRELIAALRKSNADRDDARRRLSELRSSIEGRAA